MKTRYGWLKTSVAVVIAVIYLLPIYITVNVAFRSPTDNRSFWLPPTELHLDNFTEAISIGRVPEAMVNSLIVTVASVILIAIGGALAAYPLARRRTRGNASIKGLILGMMMVPPLSILVSLYSTLVQLQGVNNYWGIILTIVTFELPLAIFLYSNFIATIPTALDEAAAIDGCGPIRTFFKVILPQLRPVTASVIILTGMHAWNDYQFSLYLLQKPDMRTLPLAISSFFSQTTSNLNAATAAALLAILPAALLFLFLQRYFIQGMVDSAIK